MLPPLTTSSLGETTLDEPVSETILRDLRRIGIKLKFVLLPRISSADETMKELRNWDLWGPLILCMTLALLLSTNSSQASTVFSLIFVLIWGGASVVTVNCQLLGGQVSFFQSVCLLGYCVFPLVLSSLVCLIAPQLSLLWVGVGLIWATRASVVFMSQLVPEDRRVLAAYPTLLFYSALAWMVLTQ